MANKRIKDLPNLGATIVGSNMIMIGRTTTDGYTSIDNLKALNL